MKIKSVTIEGLHNCKSKTYHFNNLTYLYGQNGAGKSTVLNAIQLALLGYIPGTAKTNAAIFRHASDKVMLVRLVVDDCGHDVVIERSWVGTGTNISTEVKVTPQGYDLKTMVDDLELPIFNFGELMSMTANKLKDWFIQFLPNSSSDINWKEELTSAVSSIPDMDETIIEDALATISEYQSEGVELVREVNEFFKSEQSAIKARITQLQSTINSLIYYDDAVEEDAESIQVKVNELLNLVDAIYQYQAKKAEYDRYVLSLDNAKKLCPADSIENDTEYAEICTELDSAVSDDSESRMTELQSNISDLKAKIASNVAIINGDGVCPYTHSKCESVAAQIKPLIEENAKMMKEIEAANAELGELRIKKNNRELTLKRNMDRKYQIERNYAALKSVMESSPKYEPLAPTEMSTSDIKLEINDLQSQLAKIEANKRYNELIGTITKDKFRAELEMEAYKLWAKLTDANGLQMRLAKKEFAALEEIISHNISLLTDREMSCAFNLSDKANSFSFGCKREGRYIPFDLLSSGEKCIYTLALMMSIVQRCNSPLNVIMIDDLLDHLDDENAKMMFDSLSKIEEEQFILAGVKECKSENSNAIVMKVGE